MEPFRRVPKPVPVIAVPATGYAALALDRAGQVAAALMRGVAMRLKARRDRDHLASLETRLLDDIGIERHEIDSTLGRASLFYNLRG